MDEYCAFTESRTLRIERLLPGPIERVWAYVTESGKREKWFCSGNMELNAGGQFEMKIRNADLSDDKEPPEKYKKYAEGVTYFGTVTKCEPPNHLVYLWHDEQDGDSEVSFELTPQDNDVLLVLTHRSLVRRDEVVSTASGWHAHLDILVDSLKGDKPRSFWTNFARLEAEYEKRIPVE